ncbi:hypothetical protein PR048_025527 [Dryococelus australis]|uniref:Uncharacterized protein n=1 Tax=Dryococelus australis TaxID=614101 RepID=A0ABQ9GRK5_9NEOP|nr:hypothetical protein PR048_025527 [Dryococelus australis]
MNLFSLSNSTMRAYCSTSQYMLACYTGPVQDPHVLVLLNHEDYFAMVILCSDFYHDRAPYPTFISEFDTSYPPTHPCYSPINAKFISKFKDYCGWNGIIEFIIQRAKLYAYIMKRGKGVQKSIIHGDITIKDYRCIHLDDQLMMVQVNSIRSHHNAVYTEYGNRNYRGAASLVGFHALLSVHITNSSFVVVSKSLSSVPLLTPLRLPHSARWPPQTIADSPAVACIYRVVGHRPVISLNAALCQGHACHPPHSSASPGVERVDTVTPTRPQLSIISSATRASDGAASWSNHSVWGVGPRDSRMTHCYLIPPNHSADQGELEEGEGKIQTLAGGSGFVPRIGLPYNRDKIGHSLWTDARNRLSSHPSATTDWWHTPSYQMTMQNTRFALRLSGHTHTHVAINSATFTQRLCTINWEHFRNQHEIARTEAPSRFSEAALEALWPSSQVMLMEAVSSLSSEAVLEVKIIIARDGTEGSIIALIGGGPGGGIGDADGIIALAEAGGIIAGGSIGGGGVARAGGIIAGDGVVDGVVSDNS